MYLSRYFIKCSSWIPTTEKKEQNWLNSDHWLLTWITHQNLYEIYSNSLRWNKAESMFIMRFSGLVNSPKTISQKKNCRCLGGLPLWSIDIKMQTLCFVSVHSGKFYRLNWNDFTGTRTMVNPKDNDAVNIIVIII